jgi:xylulose-5-phosphate/fructose-6-phosphate phosphoketolase
LCRLVGARASTTRCASKKGNINTPLELAILNQVDRFNLAIDVIEQVPRLEEKGAHTVGWLKGQIIKAVTYAHEDGIDQQEIREWKWPVG